MKKNFNIDIAIDKKILASRQDYIARYNVIPDVLKLNINHFLELNKLLIARGPTMPQLRNVRGHYFLGMNIVIIARGKDITVINSALDRKQRALVTGIVQQHVE